MSARSASVSVAKMAFATLLVASCAQSTTPAQRTGQAVPPPVEPISAIASDENLNAASTRIQTAVAWLADDARAGREAGTPGYADAAAYLAERFAELGVAPGNGDSFFQPVGLRITKRDDDAARLIIEDSEGVVSRLVHKADFSGGRSPAGTRFSVTAPVVYAGYGIDVDGYDSYAGLDVDGKIVAVFNGTPSDINSEIRAHAGSRRTKMKLAASRGAVGMLTMSSNLKNAETLWTRSMDRPDRGRWGFVRPDGTADGPPAGMAPAFALGPTGAQTLFENTPKDFNDLASEVRSQTREAPVKGFPLNISVTLEGSGIIEDLSSPNVVGIIEGSDPVLRNEAVILSAHLDHVGVFPPRNGGDDHIHNGAMDNAMGIATLLEVAHQFQGQGAPKRTVVLLAVTAEEKGLIGSDYFAQYPTLAGKRMVANVNLDMPLVLYPFNDVIAFGAERSTLGPLVQSAGERMGVELIEDPYPNLSLFVRSDHYSFVKQGVPSVFLFLGTGNGGKEVFETFMATNYHQPSDDLSQSISWDDAARFATLNYLIAREVADSAQTPDWVAGDYFGETFAK